VVLLLSVLLLSALLLPLLVLLLGSSLGSTLASGSSRPPVSPLSSCCSPALLLPALLLPALLLSALLLPTLLLSALLLLLLLPSSVPLALLLLSCACTSLRATCTAARPRAGANIRHPDQGTHCKQPASRLTPLSPSHPHHTPIPPPTHLAVHLLQLLLQVPDPRLAAVLVDQLHHGAVRQLARGCG
jgi:hypothetical protein